MPRDEWTTKKATAANNNNKKERSKKKKKKRGSSSSEIFKLIQSQDWSECLSWCTRQHNPREDAAHPCFDSERDTNGNSMLHSTLYNRPDDAVAVAAFLEFVDLIVREAPNLLSTVNRLGYTPLHVVCAGKNPSAELVRMLLERCPPPPPPQQQPLLLPATIPPPLQQLIWEYVPNPCLMRDAQGKTPLFLACQKSKKRRNEHSLNADVVGMLHNHTPEAASLVDKTNRRPIDVVRQCNNNQKGCRKSPSESYDDDDEIIAILTDNNVNRGSQNQTIKGGA